MDSASFIPDNIEVIPAQIPGPEEPLQLACGNPLFEIWEPIPQAPLGLLQPLYDALPTWLGGYQRDGATRALTEMLRALKTATETAIEAEIDEAYISTPWPVDEDFNIRLRTAASAVGLNQPSDAFWAATVVGKGASSLLHCDHVLPGGTGRNEVVLVLDHSDAALTATLGITTDYLLDARAILISEELGAWGLRNLARWEYDDKVERNVLLQRKYTMLVDALRRLADVSLTSDLNHLGGETVLAVDKIILLGETTDDKKLHNALEEIFGGDRLEALLANGGETGSARKDGDKLYTAAETLAKCSLHSSRLLRGKKLRSGERTEL